MCYSDCSQLDDQQPFPPESYNHHVCLMDSEGDLFYSHWAS